MLRRKLLRIILVGLILGEMISVAAIGVQDFVTGIQDVLAGHLPGKIQYGCPILQAAPRYSNSIIHEILLSCPNGPAVTISSNFYANYEGPYAEAYPTFTAPPGLLALFAFRPPVGTYYATLCSTGTPPSGYPNSDETFPGASGNPLISGGQNIYYGSETSLSYCAVVKNNATVAPFEIKWSYQYTGPVHSSSVALSASNTTIPTPTAPQQVNVMVSMRNLSDHRENMSLYALPLYGPSFVSWNYLGSSFNPPSVLINPNGTNSTILTLQIYTGEKPGLHAVKVTASPVYGFRFYGDYAGFYGYSQNSTTIYVQLT